MGITMALSENLVELLVDKYIKKGNVLSFGTSEMAEIFLKKVALKAEDEKLSFSVVPTSAKMAGMLTELGLEVVSLNDVEIDVAVEFVDQADNFFNFIKRDSHSLVRDKMIAQSAAELIIIAERKNLVARLHGKIPFEIAIFGWKRTVAQLEKLGRANIVLRDGKPAKTESNNYLAEVLVDRIYSLEDLEFQAKEIPGVLETGLFIGYADRMLLHNGHIEVKSRLDYTKQSKEAEVLGEKGFFTI